MTLTWRNKSYYRRNFNREIFQVKEDIPEGDTEYPTLWTITKDERGRQAIYYVHRQGR